MAKRAASSSQTDGAESQIYERKLHRPRQRHAIKRQRSGRRDSPGSRCQIIVRVTDHRPTRCAKGARQLHVIFQIDSGWRRLFRSSGGRPPQTTDRASRWLSHVSNHRLPRAHQQDKTSRFRQLTDHHRPLGSVIGDQKKGTAGGLAAESSNPLTARQFLVSSRNCAVRSRVKVPGRPSPIWRLSTLTTGTISAALPVRKHSLLM